jgi:protein involved in polysaccharide export with SLBB domain
MRLIASTSLLLAWAFAVDPAAAQHPAPPSVQNYLEPGDVIRLRIWREENMSGEFRVDADGGVVFPRLGAWPVGGKDAVVLKAELIEAYARYLRTPSIEVTFLRRINVGGAVQKPGVYHVDPTMTVRDVLLEAGGPTPLGRTDRVELIRDGNVIHARLRQDLPIVESPVRSGDQLYVPERSWLARNTNAAVGIGGALLSFAATMIILAATTSSSK